MTTLPDCCVAHGCTSEGTCPTCPVSEPASGFRFVVECACAEDGTPEPECDLCRGTGRVPYGETPF